jgi:hypothetical protein
MPANATGLTAPPIFKRETFTHDELAEFKAALDDDGFVFFDSLLTEEGAQGLAAEILEHPDYRAWAGGRAANRGQVKSETSLKFGLRPFNDKGPWSDQLFDAPLVRQLLGAVMRRPYHVCHTTFSVGHPGCQPISFHQDHHHFNHPAPVNLHERDGYYIQMLYYPHGFTQFDGSLEVLPGSHKVSPEDYKALLARHDIHSQADAIAQAADPSRPYLPEAVATELGLEPVTFSASPGSMVFLNARCYHGVAAQRRDSPLAHRLFCNLIFKEQSDLKEEGDGQPAGGPPHRFTQPIPPSWLEGDVSEHRRQLFDRVPYSADTENEDLPNNWEGWEAPPTQQSAARL